ncbi:MAG: N-acetylmuramoyl-L-alanine amidase [Acidobacteria bacterium]|nr:N-acetylmuramoyl-L-alanine amidase [Acidobacteriota bacterium]
MVFLIHPFGAGSKRAVRVCALLHLAVLCASVSAASDRQVPLKVTSVRFWSLGDTTRVAIETNGDFRFRSDRLRDPDRIFFDLLGVKPANGSGKMHTIPVGDRILRQIRVAETQPGTTRVVLDLDSAVEFKASQLSAPERLVVELRRVGAGPIPDTSRSTTGAERLSETAVPPPESKPARRPFEPPVERRHAERTRIDLPKPPALALAPGLAQHPGLGELVPVPVHRAAATIAATSKPKVEAAPLSLPAEPAKQNRGGGRSLTRTLGLKVGRVVLDPGHGGHDTGTIGPGGVVEKDLVLDIALRLGLLIEQRMGSDVIYTRKDDTFVPLEERTRIANEKKADLFLSIHVNSSPYSSASGAETYYLNFTTSRSALDVAARENATSNRSIHELQDLIEKIALRDKVEESREFATRLQSALFVLSSRSVAGRNRGVKKAPFVVLIGAAMPSVLAEVGFVTNPREELLLRRTDQRQKIADALYRGLSSYASTLSHFQVARRATE